MVKIKDFEPLDDNVKAEREKAESQGEYLAKIWKERTPPGIVKGENAELNGWKRSLSGEIVTSYVNALGCKIRRTLLDGSNELKSEAFIYVIEDEPTRLEALAIPGSELERLVGWIPSVNLGIDGFVELNENSLMLQITRYTGDYMGHTALPYLADSLRRGELNFPNLKLEYVTEENDVIRVTLNEPMDLLK